MGLIGYYTVFIVKAYQTSQYVVPCGGIFLGQWRSSFAGSSDDKMNVQSSCALKSETPDSINPVEISSGKFDSSHLLFSQITLPLIRS
jgi:hypothetical protein